MTLQYITKVKNAWRYTSAPLYVFIVWCLKKYKETI